MLITPDFAWETSHFYIFFSVTFSNDSCVDSKHELQSSFTFNGKNFPKYK